MLILDVDFRCRRSTSNLMVTMALRGNDGIADGAAALVRNYHRPIDQEKDGAVNDGARWVV